MAANFLGFFGKKKEEAAAQQASPPPATPSVSAVPASPPPASAFAPGRKKVTQRLSLKGLQSSTQNTATDRSKIQLPGAAAMAAPAMQATQVEGTVDIPFSVILTSIPEQLLTADHATLLAAPEAKVEIGLPLANVLGMLPSGKLEFSLAELGQLIPAGFVQPLENIGEYANTPIVLPLGKVVGRIPAHMLTLRSDQRPIDSSVLSMQDPFSKEALEKAQAEAAAKAAEAEAAKAAEESALAAPAGFGVQPDPAVEEPVAESFEEPAAEAAETPAIPEFDAELLAAAEAAMAAEKAAAAGVELPTAEDAPELPPSLDSEGFAQAALTTPEVEAEQPDWSVQPPEGEAEPEIDPALVEWAKKQADEAEAAGSSGQQSIPAAAEAPSASEEDSSFASSEAFRSFLEQVDSETAPAAEEPPAQSEPPALEAPASGSFELSGAGVFDALSAPTRPIVRPTAPPQPPVLKGFEAFKKEAEPAIEESIAPAPVEIPEPEVEKAFVPEVPVPVEAPQPPQAVVVVPAPSLSVAAVASEAPVVQARGIRLSPTINRYLGLAENAETTFQDVMNQVKRWPGVNGCVIAGKDGLSISAVVDDAAFAKSLSAFAPKIVSRVSELFVDLGMPEVQEIHVPMDDVSTFLFRYKDVYFIVLYKDASMPHWYRKVIKALLEEIGSKHI